MSGSPVVLDAEANASVAISSETPESVPTQSKPVYKHHKRYHAKGKIDKYDFSKSSTPESNKALHQFIEKTQKKQEEVKQMTHTENIHKLDEIMDEQRRGPQPKTKFIIAKQGPKPMSCKEIHDYAKNIALQTPKFKYYRIPFAMPQAAYNVFRQIEFLLFKYRVPQKRSSLSIDHAWTLGMPQELIDMLTAKMFELVSMCEHADENSEQYHKVSIGNLENVGITVLRRCFYVAREWSFKQNDTQASWANNIKNPYPFIEVDERLREYLKSLFMRIYYWKLQDQLFPLYAGGCLLFCCYTPFVGFNVSRPRDVHWQQFYDCVFDIVNKSSLPTPEDDRYWLKNKMKPKRQFTLNVEGTVEEEKKDEETVAEPSPEVKTAEENYF